MSFDLSRRDFFLTSAAAVAATGAAAARCEARAADAKPAAVGGDPFRYCLNTSTISKCQYQGKQVDAVSEVEIAAKAGYTGIEPWIRSLDAYKIGRAHV